MVRRFQAPAPTGSARALVLLAALCVISVAARAAWLGAPCHAPCRSASDHVLIFDERYYVNAARVIVGIRPPHGSPYAAAPLGVDPNAEHPQLGKLAIAGSIKLFGDGPLAWRLGSLIAGTLAILGLFALVRAAGGGRRPALLAAGLMATDNLMIVHGRIATLDVYALAAMLWSAALYLRGRPLLAGPLIGVGLCTKLVALYVPFALVLLEAGRWLFLNGRPVAGARRLAACGVSAAAAFAGLLAVLDRIARPYDDTAHELVGSGPLAHLRHMVSYAAHQTSPRGPHGIASYPWGWLLDYRPITYLNINPAQPSPGLENVHPAVHFLGLIGPPTLLLGLIGLAVAGYSLRRQPAPDRELAIVALAWFAGTFLPFVLLSLIWKRTSYLYYMVSVMPALYLAGGLLLLKLRRWRSVGAFALVSVAAAAVVSYPLTPLP